jgi:hypothetical protein
MSETSIEVLHHRIVEVSGHAIPVLDHRQMLDSLMETRNFNGHTGRNGESLDERLVLTGELRHSELVGEVQASVYLAPNLDRDPQERLHGGMIGRETRTLGMCTQMGKSERAGVDKKEPKDPFAGWTRPDQVLFLPGYTNGEKLGDGSSLVVQDTERTITGTGERASFLDDVSEEDGELQIRLEQHRRLDNPGELDWVINRRKRHWQQAYRRAERPPQRELSSHGGFRR